MAYFEPFSPTELAGTAALVKVLETTKQRSVDVYNQTNQSFVLTDLGSRILAIVYPFSHVRKNVPFGAKTILTNQVNSFKASDLVGVTPELYVELSECQEPEVYERIWPPNRTPGLSLDPSSGIYNVYGFTGVNFTYTCTKVTVKNMQDFGYLLEVYPKHYVNGVLTDNLQSGMSVYCPAGATVELDGPIDVLTAGGSTSGILNGYASEHSSLYQIVGMYDAENVLLTENPSPSSPSVGTPSTESPFVFQRDQRYWAVQQVSNYSVAAGATITFGLSTQSVSSPQMAGHQQTAYVAVNSSQTYTLTCLGSLSGDLGVVANPVVTLASAVAATVNQPALSGTTPDGTGSAIIWSADVYELVSKVGRFPGYLFQYTNTAAAAATLNVWEAVSNIA